jgi:hypothetical protein
LAASHPVITVRDLGHAAWLEIQPAADLPLSLPDNENRTMGVAHDEGRDGTEQKIVPTRIMRGDNNQVGIGLLGMAEDFATGMPGADDKIGVAGNPSPVGKRPQHSETDQPTRKLLPPK